MVDWLSDKVDFANTAHQGGLTFEKIAFCGNCSLGCMGWLGIKWILLKLHTLVFRLLNCETNAKYMFRNLFKKAFLRYFPWFLPQLCRAKWTNLHIRYWTCYFMLILKISTNLENKVLKQDNKTRNTFLALF